MCIIKGQVLNQIASKFLDATADIVPNWKVASPDPMVTVGHYCKPFPVEMIIRGYLTGSSWRTYKSGARAICGVPVPDGLKEHERFAKPIVTPTTKAIHLIRHVIFMLINMRSDSPTVSRRNNCQKSLCASGLWRTDSRVKRGSKCPK